MTGIYALTVSIIAVIIIACYCTYWYFYCHIFKTNCCMIQIFNLITITAIIIKDILDIVCDFYYIHGYSNHFNGNLVHLMSLTILNARLLCCACLCMVIIICNGSFY